MTGRGTRGQEIPQEGQEDRIRTGETRRRGTRGQEKDRRDRKRYKRKGETGRGTR